MLTSPYKSERLLAELRAAASSDSDSVQDCEVCQLLHKTVCNHLTAEQYASLKAKKVATATGESDAVYRVFECGHLYKGLRRMDYDIQVRRYWLPRLPLSHHFPGPKEQTKGFCSDCWKYIASDGRRVGSKGGRRRPPKRLHRLKVDTTRNKRPRGTVRLWSIRGPLIGTTAV
ncbi:hypothetical protein SAMD00023353_0503360 [Rosellinia necatrix]|uniref:Uncharacterized protein n=1 Tax=Rosellinia necatrix TaxID=77044 RepID=A0A1S8A5X6_ROSNE|nr:hypothetical protein SAMD00023353_0503360 [Rosellinia necatrix]